MEAKFFFIVLLRKAETSTGPYSYVAFMLWKPEYGNNPMHPEVVLLWKQNTMHPEVVLPWKQNIMRHGVVLLWKQNTMHPDVVLLLKQHHAT
jgi:hypothetical protein